MPHQPAALVVRRLLVVVERDRDADHVEIGERRAPHLFERQPIRHRSDEPLQVRVQAVGPLRRGGQAQPHRRGAENRRLAPAFARQMMLLVEDQQPEARSHLVHVDVRAVVGGHGDRPDIEGVVADDPGIIAERRQNPPMPLIHQIAHGRHDQGRDLRLGHRGKGDFRLAGPSRHDDLPATAALNPRCERLPLLRPKLRQISLGPRHPNRLLHLVLKARPECRLSVSRTA